MIGRIWYRFVRLICWSIFKIAFRLDVKGEDNLPLDGAALILSSHASHLDPVLVGVASRRRQLRYLARNTLFFWPLAPLIRSLGAIPIDREGSGIAGLRATLRVLKDGDALLLFPEGTRSKNGKLQPLKPGFCAVASRAGAVIVPVGIVGAFEALPPGSKFPHISKICLQFGEPISGSEAKSLAEDALLELVHTRIREAQESARQSI